MNKPVITVVTLVGIAALSPASANDTSVRAWGIGDGVAIPSDLGMIADVSAGGSQNIALLADGAVRMWGWHVTLPSDLDPVLMVDMGTYFALALEASGRVRCFPGMFSPVTSVPPLLGPAVHVSAGHHHALVVDRGGRVWAWGENNCGQVDVPPQLAHTVRADAGQCHSLALHRDGTVSMWGSYAAPLPANAVDITVLAGGNNFSVLVNSEGELIRAGGPLPPSNLRPLIGIAAGPDHVIAIQDDGTVRSWGSNNVGQSAPPADVMGVMGVSGGWSHQIALECTRNRRIVDSPEMSPFSFSAPRVWTAKGIADPRAGAVIKVTARGQLGTATRFLNVRADGVLVGTIFGAGTGAGACTASPSVALLPISSAQFAAMISDGAVEIRIEPSINATSAGCDTATLTVTLQYEGQIIDCDENGIDDICQLESAPLVQDCNGNGLLDACEPLGDETDCDGNGVFDSCDISRGEPDEDADGHIDACELNYGDLNLDGQVNGLDLAALLAVWGITDPPYGDLNGDGQVGGADLSFLLARWGPVP
jgi:hypothetical protein